MSGHTVLLFSLVTFVSGSIAIVIAALAANHFNDATRNGYLAFLSAFTVSVFLFLIQHYVIQNVSSVSRTFIAIWGAVDGVVDLGIVVAGVLFYHALFEVRYARRTTPYLIGLWVVVSILFVASGTPAITADATGIPVGVMIAFGTYYTVFAYLIGLCLVRLWSLRGIPKRVFGYGVFVIAAAGALESVLSGTRTATETIAQRITGGSFYFTAVPYLAWTVVSSVVLARAKTPPADSGLDQFCERFGITARERDVLVAISRGWSNQEIADRLFISLQTVKTHAHHLYEKTDTTSRTSLLAATQSLD